MTSWSHGYYADSGYSYGHYTETMPLRLRWASLIQGHNAPASNFRYLDAGCGQGYNLILAAAMHPESEFVGIDFMPEHIAHARDLAKRCGLGNVSFHEADFVELNKDPRGLGHFDYVICHGIATWIAPQVRIALHQLVGKVLAPGGLFYNSYNTYPGWLNSVPFQHLILLEQRTLNGPQAIAAARATIDKLVTSAPAMLKGLPGLEGRVKHTESQDPAYLTQEYNNLFWAPLFVTAMMDEMESVKLDYLGTATVAEAYEGLLPPDARELVRAQRNPILKEQVRDYVVNQGFRRDLYVHGKRPLWPLEQNEQILNFRITANLAAARPTGEDPYKIKTGALELAGRPDYYNPLLERMGSSGEGTRVVDLIEDHNKPNAAAQVVETVSMLIHGGWAMPCQDYAPGSITQTMKALADAASAGAPYRYVPLPAAGCALPISDIDWMLIKLRLDGVPEAEQNGKLTENLRKLGRSLVKNGEPVTEEAEQIALLNSITKEFTEKRLGVFQAMGAL